MTRSRRIHIDPAELVIRVVQDIHVEFVVAAFALEHDGCVDFVLDVVFEHGVDVGAVVTEHVLGEAVEKGYVFVGVLDDCVD